MPGPGRRGRPDGREGQHDGDPRGHGRRRPGTVLSRDEIVDAAIAVADAEGPEAVSMRRIAQVLRAGTMSLYWHVASKEHLIDLMLDTLVGEIAVPQPSGDWRADVRAYALSNRAALLRHRWVIDFIGSRPALGPNTLRSLEQVLALLDALRLDTATAVATFQAITTYISGAVLREFQELRVQREQERFAIDEQELGADIAAWHARLRSAGAFPHVVSLFEDGVDPDGAETRDQRFEFGLDCLLDGIEVRIASRGQAPGLTGQTS